MSLKPTLLKSNIYLFIYFPFFFLEGGLAEKAGLQQRCRADHHTPLGQFCPTGVF